MKPNWSITLVVLGAIAYVLYCAVKVGIELVNRMLAEFARNPWMPWYLLVATLIVLFVWGLTSGKIRFNR